MSEETPVNERRSICSHTRTEHGVYDDEPFATEGNAYYWYMRAVYWKTLARRNEGQQQVMEFESIEVCPGIILPSSELKTVRDFIKSGQIINAIKHVRTVTMTGLKESKDFVDKLRIKEGI